jgi:AcrR family transcriptional regulator
VAQSAESSREPSLRQRKKDATRTALCKASLRLFRKRGFDRTTVDDIVEMVGVSRRTFFRYFEVKGDALFDGYDERLTRFRERLRASDGDAFARIRAGLMDTAREYAENRAHLVAQFRVVQSSPALIARELELDNGWLDAFGEVLASEYSAYESRVFAGAILGAIRAALRDWFEHAGRTDIVQSGGRALDLLERGFGRARR